MEFVAVGTMVDEALMGVRLTVENVLSCDFVGVEVAAARTTVLMVLCSDTSLLSRTA